MCGTACVKHSTFWFTIVSFLLAVYAPPDRPLEKKELGLVSVSPSVSVALVSTLATVSVHFCLCRLGLHIWHSVSPLLSLSPWSPHLPQRLSTASSSVSITVRVAVIPTAPLNESIVNGYRRHSQIHVHTSFHWQGLYPNPQVNTCLQSQQLPLWLRCPNWMWLCTCCFLPQLGLPVNSRGGGPRSLGESPIGRLVLAVETHCLHVLDQDRQTPSTGLRHPSFKDILPLEEGAGKRCSECAWSPVICTMGRCVVWSLCVALPGSICVLDPRRVPELKPQWRCSCMWR